MKAVLVLCEGRHDVVFVQRSLGAVAGCRWVDQPMKDLPSPFGAIPGISEGLIARRFERLKAIITSAGQFDHPGSPLSTMIARGGIPEAQFAASPMSRSLVDFLQGAPWRNDQSSTHAA